MKLTQKAERLIPIIQLMRKYHRHSVIGMDSIPDDGSAIIATNHSLATYDAALLICAIYEERSRLVCSLIDRLFFKVPGLGELMQELGNQEGSRENASKLLSEGEIICVAPGGMRESLRPSSERYQFLWDNRKGFARMSMMTGAPVILAACPKADDIFEVYPNKLTALAYKHFKVPFFLARGLGPTPIPKPVKLIHHLSEPISPPPAPEDKDEFEEELKKYHKKLVARMRRLMSDAVMYRES